MHYEPWDELVPNGAPMVWDQPTSPDDPVCPLCKREGVWFWWGESPRYLYCPKCRLKESY